MHFIFKLSHPQIFKLLSPFYYLYQPPAFSFAEWAGFHDTYGVTCFGVVCFIMGLVRFGTLHELAIYRVHDLSYFRDSDGFVHFVADYYSETLFSEISFY